MNENRMNDNSVKSERQTHSIDEYRTDDDSKTTVESKPQERRVDSRQRPIVVLRRHSLMNERTRVRRKIETKDMPSPRRHSMRKRKSDELGGIDLSQLGLFQPQSPDELSPPRPRNSSIDSIGELFSDMNARLQQVFQKKPDPPGNEPETPFLSFRGLSNASPILEEAEQRDFNTPSAPLSPSFRKIQYRNSSNNSSINEGDSPCGVDAITRGCGACFWERSLAWSEDDEDSDDSIVHTDYGPSSALRDHLSVPEHLGKEHMNDGRRSPIRRSSSRVITRESDSRHKLGSAKMFRQTDVDNVTEIHWEEKVLDTTALEMMAKLSL